MLQLKTFPDIPVSTREEARESRPHPEEPFTSSEPDRRDPFPACSEKNSRRSRHISRGGALHRKGERNSRVVPPFLESPRCPSPFQGILFSRHCLDFQTEDRLTPRWHVGHHCGKASWESLVGKRRWKASWESVVGNPRWKASRESPLSLEPLKGKRDTAASAREESAREFPHSRGRLTCWGDSRSTPRSMSALERNPQVPAPTPHNV